MTEIDGGEGNAKSRFCSVGEEDNSAVSPTEAEEREKGQQDYFGQMYHMTNSSVFEFLRGSLCASQTRRGTTSGIFYYHFILPTFNIQNNFIIKIELWTT